MITVENLKIDLGNFQLKNITLNIKDGEFFILLGPTGSGKTVLLESIAGLKSIDEGKIMVNNTNVTNIKPEKRNISICYQDCALFPHMTAAKNIKYGLKFKKDKKNTKYKRNFDFLVKLLKIEHILHRYPTHLSGGEKQRVSLARALVIEPDILLLDEPLSALDPGIKEIIQSELKKIHNTLKTTTIMVTHSFSEAYSLADRISIIHNGQLLETGTVKEIFQNPKSEFTAKFTGMKNIFKVTLDTEASMFKIKKDTLVGIRPENIIISNKIINTSFCFKGLVTEIRGLGIYAEIDIILNHRIYTSYLTINRCIELDIQLCSEIYFGFSVEHLCIIK